MAEISRETARSVAAELEQEGEPLLPAEKKLIGWSVALGVVLLVVLGLAFNLATR